MLADGKRHARRFLARFALLTMTASLIAISPVGTPQAFAAAGCTSTTDCLSKLTLSEKAGQMTQVANSYIRNKNDITT